jgi:bacteriocin biosynthesis cyclodehydratase domain-containing protein
VIDRPAFRPAFRVEIVDDEGVFLLSERENFLLNGALHALVAPLIDGQNTVDDIVDRLAGAAEPAAVYHVLGELERRGYIAQADPTIPSGRAAFWDSLALDPAVAERRLHATTVSIVGFGAAPVEPFAAVLADLDVPVAAHGGFVVALVDDYLHDGLADLNAEQLATQRPWLLIKPSGTILWIGPLFQPGTTGCWECLAQRLRRHRAIESYLEHRRSTRAPSSVSHAAVSSSIHVALHLAALETVKAIAREQQQSDGTLLTLDLATLETQKHTLIKRPQCPRCGDPASVSARQPLPLELRSQKTHSTADGGYRIASPEQTFAKYERHISPITGALSRLTRVAVDDEGLIQVYTAAQNLGGTAGDLSVLRSRLRRGSSGKGVATAQARASGLCEALERYSGDLQGGEIRERDSYRRLGERAIHPNACMLYSPQQYHNRQQWNERSSPFQHVPHPLDEDRDIDWTPLWNLTRREFNYLPTSYCYYGHPEPAAAYSCRADSNGNAAGNSVEEAILQGFMELVERDAVALWWYNRVRRPALDLGSFDEPYIRALTDVYRTLNRELWVLDLTSDLEIPVFAAVSRRTDQAREEIALGFGAHFDPKIALLRALTELNQLGSAELSAARDERVDLNDDPDRQEWRKTATLANQSYLAPAQGPLRSRRDYDVPWSDDLRDDVLRCQSIVERRGMEMLVLDQTREDIGLPVVKVVVPGLRHYWARFAPGRLYDVPVKLGWLSEPLAEDRLNPIPVFF